MATAIKLDETKLKTLIKESVKEAIDLNLMNLRVSLLPFVSSKEQKNISRFYGKPSRNIARTRNVKI